MEGGMAGGMAVNMGLWLLTHALLWIVPLWFILPRAGLSRYLSLVSVVPLGGFVMLWIAALKRWPGEKTRV